MTPPGAVLEEARRTAARVVNTVLTATYSEIGRRIVEHEQGGEARAAYGKKLLDRLAADLTARFGRGFGVVNLSQMKRFHRLWPAREVLQTPSGESDRPGTTSDRRILQTASAESGLTRIAARFPLPWSAYVRLLAVKSEEARTFCETEALRGDWSVRQLDRQIQSQFYERTALCCGTRRRCWRRDRARVPRMRWRRRRAAEIRGNPAV